MTGAGERNQKMTEVDAAAAANQLSKLASVGITSFNLLPTHDS